jgi:hypothetical protein
VGELKAEVHEYARTPRRGWGSVALFAITFMGTLWGVLAFSVSAGAISNRNGTSSYEAAPRAPHGAEIVYLGIEPLQTFAVNLTQETFQTSFFIWWRWKGPIDPVATTDVLNSTASSSFYSVQYSSVDAFGIEEPTTLANGYEYQSARISTGVSDPFSLSRYPLDTQHLIVRIENSNYDYSQLVYVPDVRNLSINSNLAVPGWGVHSVSMHAYLHRYGTNFGALGQGDSASEYSQVTFDVDVTRPVSHFLMKLLVPLLIVFGSTLALFFVKVDEYDIIPVTGFFGILTLLFLQQTYSLDLPRTAPLVLIDEIYAVAYIALAVAYIRSIWVMNQIHHDEREHHEFIAGNRMYAYGLTAGFIAAVCILVFV